MSADRQSRKTRRSDMEQLLSDPPKSKACTTAEVVLETKRTRSRGAFLLGVGIRAFILLLIGGLILVVAHDWDFWVGSSALQSTNDAYLQADTTPLAARVPGYVKAVHVQDFQRVHARRTASCKRGLAIF
jgi:membrane fusion protein (multidrug efflux system)